MIKEKKIILTIIILSFLGSIAFGIEVKIIPKDDSNTIYPYERKEFSITITNDTNEWIENAELSLTTEKELYIASGYQKKPSKYKIIARIAPEETINEKFEVYLNAEETEETKIKAILKNKNLIVETNYKLEIKSLPIEIELEQQKRLPNNKYAIEFSITNLAEQEIEFVKTTILPTNKIIETESKETTNLKPQESFKGTIYYKSEKEQEPIIRIIFKNQNGTRFIEKQIRKVIRQENVAIATTLVVLVILIVAYYFSTKKKHWIFT